MGWGDIGGHEGWAAAVFGNGAVSIGARDGATMVQFLDSATGWDDKADPGVLDGRMALGWRAVCECGWSGPLWSKVYDRAQENRNARRIFDPNPSVYGTAPPGLEEEMYTDWRAHACPVEDLDLVRQEAA